MVIPFLALVFALAMALGYTRPDILGEFSGATKPSGPLIYWKFNEVSGTTLNDSSTYDNDGTFTGPDKAVEEYCVEGRCLYFDGSFDEDAFRDYASDTDLDIGTNDFTVSIWFKHVAAISGTQDYLVSRYAGAGFRLYLKSSGVLCFGIDDDSTWGPDNEACTTDAFNDNQWHHVSAVRSGSSMILYVNGRQLASQTITATGSLSGTSAGVYLSTDSNNNDAWHGWIDEFRFYGYARSEGQSISDFNNLGSYDALNAGIAPEYKGSVSSGLVGYWPMDESAANTCSGGTNDSCDASSAGNDGAWNGNATFTFPARFHYGTTFDGTDDNITVADSSTLSPDEVTLAAWVYPTSVNSRALVVKNNAYRMTTDASGFLQCQMYVGGSWQTATVSNTALLSNTLAHVACTYDGLSVVAFVNGVRTALDDLTGNINDSSDNLVIGEDPGGTFTDYAGRMDDVRVYNRGMSEDEISNLFDWGPTATVFYNFDERTGSTATDISGNGYNGTFNGNTAWTNGQWSGGLRFDGTDDYTQYIDVGVNRIETPSSWSASVWVKPNLSAVDQTIISKVSDPATQRETLAIIITSDEFQCRFTNTSGSNQTITSSNVNFTTGRWYHVACVFDDINDKFSIYVQGAENAVSDDQTSQPYTAISTGPFTVGGSGALTRADLNGSVDHVKVYNYALSGKQVIRDYNAGQTVGGFDNGPMGYWAFEESSQADAVGTGTSSNPLVFNSGTYGSRLDGSRVSIQFDGNTSGYYKAGIVGTAMQFLQSSDDRVSLTSDASLDNLNIFTLTAWIHPYTFGENNLGTIFTKSSTTTSMFDLQLYNSGAQQSLRFYRNRDSVDTEVIAPNSSIPLNQWTHVAIVYNSATVVRMYINGEEVAYATRTLGSGDLTSDSGNTAHLGSISGINSFNGIMDEVKLYSYTLSPREILTDYNAGAAVTVGGNGPVVTPQPTVTPQSQIGTDAGIYDYCLPGFEDFCYAPYFEWRFERIGTSSTLFETAGRFANFDASNNGSTLTRNGKYGYARDYDGANDYVDLQNVGGASGYNVGSFSFWFKPDFSHTSANTTRALAYARASNSSNWHLAFRGTDYSGGAGSAGDLVFKNEISDTEVFLDSVTSSWTAGTWYHVSVNWDGSNYYMYINGILEDTASSGHNMFAVNSDTNIGRVDFDNDSDGAVTGGPTRYFDGVIDEVYVFDYVRTQRQIKYEMNKGVPIAQYKFDECNPSTTTIYDSSGSGYHGTYNVSNNGTTTSAGNCTSGNSAHAWERGRNGRYNSAAYFDGNVNGPAPLDEHIRLPDNAFDTHYNGTVAMWIDPLDTGDGTQALFAVGEQESGGIADGDLDSLVIAFSSTNNRIEFYVYDNGTLTIAANADALASPTEWNHIAVTMSDSAGLNIFVNGERRPVTFTTGNASTVRWYDDVSANTTQYTIGCVDVDSGNTSCYEDNMYEGMIDDLRIYDYVVTDVQMKTIYNDGASFRYGPVNERAE
jgi:hypothetical protein